jgi:hypothetical protein
LKTKIIGVERPGCYSKMKGLKPMLHEFPKCGNAGNMDERVEVSLKFVGNVKLGATIIYIKKYFRLQCIEIMIHFKSYFNKIEGQWRTMFLLLQQLQYQNY